MNAKSEPMYKELSSKDISQASKDGVNVCTLSLRPLGCGVGRANVASGLCSFHAW
jgi:hypothetical protein